MDPNETLALMRASIRATRDAIEGNGDLIDSADELATYAEALDDWLTRGGFLPAAWAQS